MSLLEILPKNIAILLILSPFFISVFVLAKLVKKGLSKAEKYPMYWLFASFILFIGWLNQLFQQKTDFLYLFWFGQTFSTAIATYLTLKKK